MNKGLPENTGKDVPSNTPASTADGKVDAAIGNVVKGTIQIIDSRIVFVEQAGEKSAKPEQKKAESDSGTTDTLSPEDWEALFKE